MQAVATTHWSDFSGSVTAEQLRRAEDLAMRGQLCYHPYTFADDFQVGAGYHFLHPPSAAMCHRPSAYQPGQPHVIDPSILGEFVDGNNRLRRLYDSIVTFTCDAVGDLSGLTFADVGCNSGYMTFSFALRGAESVGYDREDYTEAFALMNEIVAGRVAQDEQSSVMRFSPVTFEHAAYSSKTRTMPGMREFDVVTSLAVLCHLHDPLEHLAMLGSMAKKALLVWAPTVKSDDYVVWYGAPGVIEPNRFFADAPFPECFTTTTKLSPPMLRKSLELMGFKTILQMKNVEGGMPDHWFDQHVAMLALR